MGGGDFPIQRTVNIVNEIPKETLGEKIIVGIIAAVVAGFLLWMIKRRFKC